MRNQTISYNSRRFLALTIIFAVCVAGQLMAASRNLLPRFPEIVLEKGFSENFQVTECIAKVRIGADDAASSMDLTLKNRGDKSVKSSVKFRILYPTSESQVQIKINGKSVKYDRKSPRHAFELEKDASITFQVTARTDINYSIDGVREALRKEHEDEPQKGKKFDLSGFMNLFDREKFGKRFLVGPLASKWGVFPLEFEKVQLEIIVPSDYTIVAKEMEKWQEKDGGREKTFTFKETEGFEGAVFLPETDKKEFLKTQEILTSNEFMH